MRVVGLVVALALVPSLALAQEGLVTMSVDPPTVRLVAGEARTVLVRIVNGATQDAYIETPTVEGLPDGITLGALEGEGGSRPDGTPPGTWLLHPGETKEFQLIFNPNRAVVRTNTTVVLHARTSADQPSLEAPLQVVVLSVFGSSDRSPAYTRVPPAAWAGLAGVVMAGGLVLMTRSDAGRLAFARRPAQVDPASRARILELVRAAPGISFDELVRASGERAGAVAAAIEVLEREGAVRVGRAGLRRLHFPK